MASRPATHIINNWRAKRERTALLVVGDAPGVSVCLSLSRQYLLLLMSHECDICCGC